MPTIAMPDVEASLVRYMHDSPASTDSGVAVIVRSPSGNDHAE